MGSKLSHKLIDLGFFSALGTSETSKGKMGEYVYVKRGKPRTYDSNNGVTVVYDEDGRPWIIITFAISKVAVSFNEAVLEHNLQRGAYVPHSNDGCYFIHKVIPKL